MSPPGAVSDSERAASCELFDTALEGFLGARAKHMHLGSGEEYSL